jgi:hypothetical protein
MKTLLLGEATERNADMKTAIEPDTRQGFALQQCRRGATQTERDTRNFLEGARTLLEEADVDFAEGTVVLNAVLDEPAFARARIEERDPPALTACALPGGNPAPLPSCVAEDLE